MILRDMTAEDDEVPDELRFQRHQWEDSRFSRGKNAHLSAEAIASICGRPDTSRRIRDLMASLAQKLKETDAEK